MTKAQETKWQPIGTAPDTTCIVLSRGQPVIATRVVGDLWAVTVPGTPILFQPELETAPTHWMPLPAAPGK